MPTFGAEYRATRRRAGSRGLDDPLLLGLVGPQGVPVELLEVALDPLTGAGLVDLVAGLLSGRGVLPRGEVGERDQRRPVPVAGERLRGGGHVVVAGEDGGGPFRQRHQDFGRVQSRTIIEHPLHHQLGQQRDARRLQRLAVAGLALHGVGMGLDAADEGDAPMALRQQGRAQSPHWPE